jgi:hypothetical protein
MEGHLARDARLVPIPKSHLSNIDLERASGQLPHMLCPQKGAGLLCSRKYCAETPRSLSAASWLHLLELYLHEIRVGAALCSVPYEFGVKFGSRESILHILFRHSIAFL